MHVDALASRSYKSDGCYPDTGNELKQENAIFKFHTIEFEKTKFNLFYDDSGCGDLVIRKSAIDSRKKLNRAYQIAKGPLISSGVGDVMSVCEHGAYG